MAKFYVNILLLAASACLVTCGPVQSPSGDVIEPCACNLSLECVINFFNENAQCSSGLEGSNSVLVEDVLPIYVPAANLTAITTGTDLDFQDVEVESFFIDKDTNTLVMAVNFIKGIFCDAKDVIFSVDQLGKEPRVVVEDVTATYPCVLTALIPLSDDGVTLSSLERSTVTAYFPALNVDINIGPRFSQSQDPVFAASYASLFKDPLTTFLEIARTKASYLFLSWMEAKVCKLGAKPTINLPYKYDTTVVNSILEHRNDASSVTRPCGEGDDLTSCARDYIIDNGECSISEASEPFHRELFNMYIPWLNFTAIIKNAEMTGLDGVVKSLYVNEETKNLVMAVEFEGIVMSSPEVPFIMYQRGDMPRTISDYNIDTYPVTLTFVIPTKDGLNANALETALASAYFKRSNVQYEIGDSQEHSDDPQVSTIIHKLRAEPMKHVDEIFVTEACRLMRLYLQKNMCDFQVPVDPFP